MSEDVKSIWCHGYGCECSECKNSDEDGDFVLYANEDGVLDRLEMPVEIGETIYIADQQGRTLKLERVK